MKTVTLGLLGFGTVGGGAYEALKMTEEQFTKKLGIKLEVKKILVNTLKKNAERTSILRCSLRMLKI